MQNVNGPQYIINLEGIDGTGKNTVSKELRTLFEAMGKKVFTLHFPVYGTPTGDLVSKFLTGEFGDPTQIHPITASLFYTIDRLVYFRAHPEIFTDYDVLIFDRSYMSNFFFQSVKFLPDVEKTIRDKLDYIDKVADYIRKMFPMEITYSPLDKYQDRINTFMLYHPNIQTNFRLMELRGGELDKHESNRKYLSDISTAANTILDNLNLLRYKLSENEYNAYYYTPVECSDNEGNLKTINSISWDILLKLGIYRDN